MQLRTPVAMMVFSRPETTRRVFEVVRAARPERLLVVADGPRAARPADVERCATVRAIFDAVDWPCVVEREFAAENLGCRRRMASGLDWVFSRCEEAIVLEDDCLPDPSFFPYCEELLERYRDDRRVMAVGGVNFQDGARRGDASYYFSRFVHVWGWATWRRAWQRYDAGMSTWPARRAERYLETFLGSPEAAQYWRGLLDRTYAGEIDTWDYQWLYAVWQECGVVATPNVNLVSNIGAGPEATNTQATNRFFDLPTRPIELPLRHPARVAPDHAADAHVQATMFRPPRRKGRRGLWQLVSGE